ncbi:hypothetical protein ABZ154_18615 [Streptomyces sp. NPDC006261]|uniref:hypothetical protein n=1 Tax=Streptomyces sp. NPDC006261 TaxID=3156739 RepID=UPI0033AB9446
MSVGRSWKPTGRAEELVDWAEEPSEPEDATETVQVAVFPSEPGAPGSADVRSEFEWRSM